MNFETLLRFPLKVLSFAIVAAFLTALFGLAHTAEAQNGTILSASYRLTTRDGWRGYGPAYTPVTGTVSCANGLVVAASITIPGTGGPGQHPTKTVITIGSTVRFDWSRAVDGLSFGSVIQDVRRSGNRFDLYDDLPFIPNHKNGGIFAGVVDLACPPVATPTPTCTIAPPPTKIPTPVPTPTAVCTVPPTPTATPACAPVKPIEPIAECVTENNDGTFTAYVGYDNANTSSVTVPLGVVGTSINQFTPGQINRGQPTVFKPGRVVNAFSFSFDGNPYKWTLQPSCCNTSRAIVVSRLTKRCDTVRPVLECVDRLPTGSTAKFGYQNTNPFEIAIPIGPRNLFVPSPQDRGQPTTFVPGRVVNAFQVPLPDGGSLTWNLDGRTVTADKNSASCNPNRPPTCSIKVPSNLQCQGTTTRVALDGSASIDPDGFPVVYKWTTTCPQSSFSSTQVASPTLSLAGPGAGQAANCEVKLTVDDGLSSSMCSAPIVVPACTDCKGQPGGSAVVDQCGVCGGDGKSCVDCLGVVNGTAKVDQCGVCNGTNKCVDCKGVPNGTAKVDECGICGGDGTECISCVKTDSTQDLFALDLATIQLKANIIQLSKRVERTAKSEQGKRLARRSRQEADALQVQGWTAIWSYPAQVDNCTGSSACSQSSLATNKQKMKTSFDEMIAVERRLARQLKAQLGGELRPDDIKLTESAERIYQGAITTINGLPEFQSVCGK